MAGLLDTTQAQITPLKGSDIVNLLLIDIAAKIQLTKTEYGLAMERTQTLYKWMQREESQLKGLITDYYPQGSMAIGATISTASTAKDSNEYDIDVIAEIKPKGNVTPADLLTILENSLKGERYSGKLERNKRCVTVFYEGMHLDITPCIRVGANPKEVVIAHWDDKTGEQKWVDANPWGFAEYFKGKMPTTDTAFAETYSARAQFEQGSDNRAFYRKPKALVSLQLLKRWRNLKYESREGRMPPSVMLSRLVSANADVRPNSSLFEELQIQANWVSQVVKSAHEAGKTLHVTNPVYEKDVFTDRWPAGLTAQKVFLEDLQELKRQLAELAAEAPLPKKKAVLEKLFGEKVAGYAVQKLATELGQKSHAGGLLHETKGGNPSLKTLGVPTILSAPTVHTPRNTNFGTVLEEDE